MKKILLAPEPRGDGGPSLAVRRLLPYLTGQGDFHIVDGFWSGWDQALVNVGGGYRGIGVLVSAKPFLFRSAGYYLRDIFDRTGRKWYQRYDWMNFLTRQYLVRASWVIFQSDYSRRVLMGTVKDSVRRYSVVHNGVDLDRYCPQQRDKNKVPTIGSVGKMRHERIRDLVRVSQNLKFEHKLLIVGRISEHDRTLLDSHSVQQGTEVSIMGHVPADQLPRWYNQIDVLVHLAAADDCPNVIVETLACGTPAVCHAYGGTVELVGSGGIAVSGTVYENDDDFIDRTAMAIGTILDDLQGFRERARTRAESALDIRKTSAAYIQALENLSIA